MAGFPVTGDQYRDIDRKVLEIKRQLNQKDGCPQDPEYLKKGLQALIEGRFKAKPKRKIDYVFGMFVPYDIQIENIRKWNDRYGWGFTEAQIARVSSIVPTWPMDTRFKALVLVPYLDEVWTTFDVLWSVVAKRQYTHWRHEEFGLPAGRQVQDHYLRLLYGIKHPGKCLRWEVIDLAANWDKKNGIAPNDVRNVKSSHAGVLAAAAHHPRWVRAMDGKNVPYAWLPGYECGGAELSCRRVPWLYFAQDGRVVGLDAYESDSRHYSGAVPTIIYEGCGY